MFPEHLGSEFISGYETLTKERLTAKANKEKIKESGLKISINGTYGNLINQHCWLFDPLAGMRVTLNGQLFLSMLAERLTLAGIKVVSANTDGLTSLVKKDLLEKYYDICKKWEAYTKMTLEFVEYTKIVRSDVNNYLAFTKEGKVKEKGKFVREIDLSKGYRHPIVAKALYEYFVNNTPVRETISKCDNIYDFCISIKTGREKDTGIPFKTILKRLTNGELFLEEQQKTNRFYVSNRGGLLVKVGSKGNEISYIEGYNVTIFNDFFHKRSLKEYDVCLDYYVAACNKIIHDIENTGKKKGKGIGTLSLF